MNIVLGQSAADAALVPGRSQDFEDFIYLISHDVRNSVRALIEVPQWIAEDLRDAGVQVTGSVAENIDLMNIHTRRLDRMLADLLVYSRIGRLQDMVRVDLMDAWDSVRQEVAVPRSVRVETDLGQPGLLFGERDIMTLLTALLSNAVRHRDGDTTLVRFTSRQEGDETVLTFQDNGPGIALQFREKAFSAMATLKSRDEVEGSGMGLAHVRKIVEAYGGQIRWLDLTGGRGVGFEFRFAE